MPNKPNRPDCFQLASQSAVVMVRCWKNVLRHGAEKHTLPRQRPAAANAGGERPATTSGCKSQQPVRGEGPRHQQPACRPCGEQVSRAIPRVGAWPLSFPHLSTRVVSPAFQAAQSWVRLPLDAPYVSCSKRSPHPSGMKVRHLLLRASQCLKKRTATPAHEGCLMGYEYQGQPSAGFSFGASHEPKTKDSPVAVP